VEQAKKAAAAPVSVAAVPQAAAEGSTSSSDALLDAVASTDSVASKVSAAPRIVSSELTSATQAENDGQAGEISSKEVIKRLRRRGEPIRLFGESDDDRVKRLRALEHATKDETMAAQNVFRANIKLMDKKLDLDALQRNADDDHHKEEKEKRKKAGMLLPIVRDCFCFLLPTKRIVRRRTRPSPCICLRRKRARSTISCTTTLPYRGVVLMSFFSCALCSAETRPRMGGQLGQLARGGQANEQRKERLRDNGPMQRRPPGSLQTPSQKGTVPPFLTNLIPLVRRSRTTCCSISRASSSTCKPATMCTRATSTIFCRSATRPGLSVSRWSAFTSVRLARRFSQIKSPVRRPIFSFIF